jgi:hypothetical protein
MTYKEKLQKYIDGGAPKEILRENKYRGVLIDIQPLVDGQVIGIYQFDSGQAIGGTVQQW